jgi:hypothetical protein
MTLVLVFKKSVANRARYLLRDGNGGIGAVTPYCAAEVAVPLSLWATGAAK